jgi:hypothetical protein
VLKTYKKLEMREQMMNNLFDFFDPQFEPPSMMN